MSSGQAAVNPCTLCAPLGGALATMGVARAIPLLHGAQGCATYIRRYLISHFREPVDIASSSFGEAQTVFGGEGNLERALDNLARTYRPDLVTISTTCLAETIGEDVTRIAQRYREKRNGPFPIVCASTPSYKDGHVEGFHTMVHALVRDLSTATGERLRNVNVLAPLISPADLRHLREMAGGFGVGATLLPDYSDTLDGVVRDHYEPLAAGGTPLQAIATMAQALGTLDCTLTGRSPRASALLEERGVPASVLGLPIGVRATDAFVDRLAELSGVKVPDWLQEEKGRLLDAYADGHKYVFGKRVAIYGDPEWVAALAGFVMEIGAVPVVCATGARNRALAPALAALGAAGETLDDTDFTAIEAACRPAKCDLVMGSSKGYRMARALGVPLLRFGFPIHDRLGAGRLLSMGYRGTTRLFDSIVNTLLERKQETSSIGYSYL